MRFLFVAGALLGMARAALADPVANIPTPLLPAVKCIYGVLKSSNAVKSVDVYSTDDIRIYIEFAFNGKDEHPAVSYVELVGLFLGDQIPRDVSEHAMKEGVDLTSDLHLAQKCHLEYVLDNLLPQPAARLTWRRIHLPKNFY